MNMNFTELLFQHCRIVFCKKNPNKPNTPQQTTTNKKNPTENPDPTQTQHPTPKHNIPISTPQKSKPTLSESQGNSVSRVDLLSKKLQLTQSSGKETLGSKGQTDWMLFQ